MSNWAQEYAANMKRVNANAQEREKKRTMDATGDREPWEPQDAHVLSLAQTWQAAEVYNRSQRI